MAEISDNKSGLKSFLASIASIKGDLSNITAPPFLLAPQSTTQFPKYWVENPATFVAPAQQSSPELRALLVLKWFLGSLRAQQYAGRDPSQGVKKPLNAILGELFVAQWEDAAIPGVTRLVSEQVSHHPPVTACCLWNDECGVRAEGYTRQKISFSGSVHVQQIGHAILHIDEYGEDYLVPLPDVTVSGILSGTPYPELSGKYYIVGSNGYTSEVNFSGKGFFGGNKNGFEANLYHSDDPKTVVSTVKGVWSDRFTFHDVTSDKDLLTVTPGGEKTADIKLPPIEEQDPWESQKVWSGTIEGLEKGDMGMASDHKSKLEQAQRDLRKAEEANNQTFKPLFFKAVDADPLFEKLAQGSGQQLEADKTEGVWKFDKEAFASAKRPYRGTLTPYGEQSK